MTYRTPQKRGYLGKFSSRWLRYGIHAGLLAGLGAAFWGGGDDPVAVAMEPECQGEDQCSFKKPIMVLTLDYSTSMNNDFGNNLTRWEAAKEVLQNLMEADQGFVSDNMLVGLVRFGHDPDPNNPNTTIVNDNSGIVDGQSVDVLWWDEDNGNQYKECNGQEIIDSLAATPAPIDGALTGIGTWTNGALLKNRELMEQSLADHPDDVPAIDNRFYTQLVITDGEWTNPAGTGQDAEHDPSNTAADVFNNGVGDQNDPTSVPTYVVYFGELNGGGEQAANDLAASGGTNAAITAENPEDLFGALVEVVDTIKSQVVEPNCIGGLPRVMVLVDGSSSMLNGDDDQPAPKFMSGWDQARFALAGENALFDQDILDDMMMPTGQKVEDLVHLGLAVFGHNNPMPGEQKIMVNYGPCMQDNFYWAMSPEVSDPACPDIDYGALIDDPATPINAIIPDDFCDTPWSGSPINWSFPASVGGLPDPLSDPDGPGFDLDTYAHMPRCDDPGNNSNICTGSGTYTHLGLQLIKENQIAYHAQALLDEQANDSTVYINILITDGRYDSYSTDAQVQAELEEMASNGILTYVIGLGAGVNDNQAQTQLMNMAVWGGTNQHYDADNQQELELALVTIFEGIQFDPCCNFNDCSENPEPNGNEPDPPPPGLCFDDGDCEDGEVCSFPDPDSELGNCVPDCACSEDADCAAGEVCDGCQCIEGPCTDDSQCNQDNQPPEICEDGICVPGPCGGDNQCPGNLVCVDEECIQGECPAVPCPAGEMCVDGVCVVPPCTSDDQCNPGEVCDPDLGCVPDGGVTSSSTGVDTTETTSEPDTDTDDGTTEGPGPVPTEPGCGCATADEAPLGGTLASIFGLGLLGLTRRRRRA